jgi:hypothetical protein
MMNATELFLKTIDAYKAWIKTGMDFMSFSDLYERWDEALLAYAKAMNITRSEASLHITEAMKRENI